MSINLADLELDFSDYTPDVPSRVLASPPKTITPINPADPARLGYPPTLPIEIALRTSPVDAVCEAYGISPEEWALIVEDPTFQNDMLRATEMLKEDGVSFKLKAQLQANQLLQTSWNLIHNDLTPPNVRADLIKSTVKWAGLEPQPATAGQVAGNGFTIAINFNGEKPEPRLVNP